MRAGFAAKVVPAIKTAAKKRAAVFLRVFMNLTIGIYLETDG